MLLWFMVISNIRRSDGSTGTVFEELGEGGIQFAASQGFGFSKCEPEVFGGFVLTGGFVKSRICILS